MAVADMVIVYVEDDPLSRQVMQLTAEHVLRIKNLFIFDDSTDIVTLIKAIGKRPDVIFLDIQVRPHDGYEMVDMIRHDPELREVKVVAITASVVNAVERLRAGGFDSMINKPVNPSSLRGLIERIIQGEQIWEHE